MKEQYLDFYRNYTSRAYLRFMRDGFFVGNSGEKRAAALNRLRDYIQLAGKTELQNLHLAFNKELLRAKNEWTDHDYGAQYFYQSCDLVGVRGLRDTRARVDSMNLEELVRDKTVIDVGCNTGFLALSIASAADHVVGLEVNPHLIKIGNLAKDYLGTRNVDLHAASFEEFQGEPADVLLSLANHTTYDGNTKHTVGEYLKKCSSLIKSGGMLIFESHHPGYETADHLQGTKDLISGLFTVIESRVLDKGTFADRGRTFIIAEKSRI